MQDDLYPRGIYLPKCFDKHGFRYLAVIDSRHRVLFRHRLLSREPVALEQEAAAETPKLRRLLDSMDPVAAPAA
jgi:hypothetical protein